MNPCRSRVFVVGEDDYETTHVIDMTWVSDGIAAVAPLMKKAKHGMWRFPLETALALFSAGARCACREASK